MKESILIFIVRIWPGLLLLILTTSCLDGRSADYSRLENRPRIGSTAFNGSDNAWFVTATEGQLLITKDSGAHWTTVPGQAVGTRFESVEFITDKRGLASNRQGQIWRTADGGLTWFPGTHLSATKPDEWEFMSSSQMRFTDDIHGWLVETFTIWRTENGGMNWKQVFSVLNPGVKGQPGRGFFLNGDTGWASNNNGGVYRTTNGGTTWELIPIAKNGNVTDIFFINERTGWLSAFEGQPPYTKIYRSDDGGKTWNPQPIPNDRAVIVSVDFVSEQEGWCAGRIWTGDRKSSSGIVLHTIDGGETWAQAAAGEHEPSFDKIYFPDSQHGWLFGYDKVYRSGDGGKSWQVVLKLPPNEG